jgi:hypothetical protein
MFRKFLNMFFPGFSWEHGFALWDMGTAFSVGGSILGGMMGNDAADEATGAQVGASKEAIEELRKIGDRTRGDTVPYRNLGSGSADKLSYLLGIGNASQYGANGQNYGTLVDTSSGVPDKVAYLYGSDPQYRKLYDEYMNMHKAKYTSEDNPTGGYTADSDVGQIDAWIRAHLPVDHGGGGANSQFGSLLSKFGLNDLNNDVVYKSGLDFGLAEGEKAINRRASAFGGYDSGATLKALTRFGNDYGTTKAEGAYNRFNTDKLNSYNMLMGGTGVGQNAVNTDANTGTNLATAIGSAQMGAGNARAAGVVGGANAWGNALSGVGNAWNAYQGNKTTDRILTGMGY